MKAFRAKVRFFSTADGGRKTPVQTGYRSLLRPKGSDATIGFQLTLDSGDLELGKDGSGTLTFWAEDVLPSLKPGQQFEILEGVVVGSGVVVGDIE